MPIKCYYLPLKPRKLTVYIYLLRGALIWIALLWGSNDMRSMVSLKHQLWTLPATDTMQKGIHKFFSWDSPVLQFAMACCSSRDSLKTSKNYSGEMMSYIYIQYIFYWYLMCQFIPHTQAPCWKISWVPWKQILCHVRTTLPNPSTIAKRDESHLIGT